MLYANLISFYASQKEIIRKLPFLYNHSYILYIVRDDAPVIYNS